MNINDSGNGKLYAFTTTDKENTEEKKTNITGVIARARISITTKSEKFVNTFIKIP